MEEWEADAAEADADLVPDAAAEADVEEAAADEELELELALFAAVAFRVPHFSLLLHVAWPIASFGWLLIHCT
jgi:hypothetical protein